MWQDAKNIYHLSRALGANIFYGFPGRKMQVIGITGTDGKTTTASILYHILKEAGYKTALISTVAAIINGKAYDTGFHVTTPGGVAVQKYLRQAAKAGIQYLILETTSIGLHQNRVYGIPFRIGILTNITNEHLDYHKTYENYVAAKAKLLKASKTVIVNQEDKSFSYITPYIKSKKVITYGLKKNTMMNPSVFPVRTKMLGDFNTYNALAAVSAAKELGVEDAVIQKALLSFLPPQGREEIVYDKDFTVIIDFAHTPNSLANILPEAKKLAQNRLIHVFGAAAQRDTYKRPQMGEISSQYADIIILTAEDPRNESIEKIMDEIQTGMKYKKEKDQKYPIIYRVPDRKQAIFKAIELARKGDVVITTGKGHEKSMNYGNGEEAWSEHEAVQEAIQRRNRSK